MPVSRSKLVVAVVLAVLLGLATYLGSTVGVRALRSSEVSLTTDPGSVPEFVYNVPDTVPTTAAYGPVGPVSVVFAGTDVRTGLSGEQDNPWIAVSSQTGEYRALSAPHLPEPAADAVSVSQDGRVLAWGYDHGVVIYDPVEDEARELDGSVGASPLVGSFSPDGSHLAVFDGALRVIEVASGEEVATLGEAGEREARQAVWTPDGEALTYVVDGRLVTHPWQSDARTTTPAPIAQDATLAWQSSGKQLAATQEAHGVRSVEIFDVSGDGRLEPVRTVSPDGYAQQELLGFTGESRVTVSALTLETATLVRVYDMSTVDTRQPTQVMQLPGGGTNWVGAETVQVATQPLAAGSAAFEEPRWPWSDLSKLVASIILAVFALGIYLTRPVSRRMRNR
ncbi:MAG: hypothetical protein ACRDPJ_11300 [Nocardioidaceae bacterium]